ncbi:MAG: B12-binding domain-containing radical SAM protein [Candidatus Omnitrophica bacterium]|nr:B12-binding domain-containing radical SAM protein [Candidatus Omnitrophota bacterium]
MNKYRFRMVIPAYPAFNVYSNIARMTTCLGPVYVATNVHKMSNWDAEVIDENNFSLHAPKDEFDQPDHGRMQRQRPADVVGFYGGLTSTVPRLYEVAGFYKSRGVITVAGGQHFSGDNILDALSHGIDYVVIGEGELVIKELLAAIMGQGEIDQVKGLAYFKNGKLFFTGEREKLADFDQLPLPDFSLVRYARIKIYPVERIRGCGMDCEFCTVKGQPRPARPERLLAQISILVETRDARHFFIVDDLFGQYRDETIRFCYILKDYQKRIGKKLDFTAQIRLDKAKDPELLSAMYQAGINKVCIGYESPIAEELKAMNKHIQPEDMLALTKIFHDFGFLVHGMFIFGYPLDEGTHFTMTAKERVERYLTFIRKAKLDTVQVLLPVPLPGTLMTERLKRQKRIYDIRYIGWEFYDGNFPIFEPDAPLTAEEMQASQKQIMTSFYQFKYFLKIGLDILMLPAVIIFFHDIQRGWINWYRYWRNDLLRVLGWGIVKEWNLNFKKNRFVEKLQIAKGHIRQDGYPFASHP